MRATLQSALSAAGCVVRSATPADAPVVAELVEALNRSEGDPTGYVTPETMARDLARGQIAVILAAHAAGSMVHAGGGVAQDAGVEMHDGGAPAQDAGAAAHQGRVAAAGAGIAGYCLYHFGYEATFAATGYYICDLYVRPDARRRGVARALLAEVARRSEQDGGTFLWWTAKPGNEVACAVYDRLRAYREPVVAHAVFDDTFAALAAEGRARQRCGGG